MADFSHIDESGRARMVDVGDKPISRRRARASGLVRLRPETIEGIQQQQLKKGDVLQVARIAGIQGAKQTSQIIPLCHPLPLSSVEVHFSFPDESTIRIESVVNVTGQTGVEMEALTAVSIAALTVYDMCKSVDRTITIQMLQLEEKSGGTSGPFKRKDLAP